MTHNEKLHVYLAGPDVFLPNPIKIGEAKKRLVEHVGCIAHFPMDPEIKNWEPNEETAIRIAKENEALMDICQVITVNMTPWHGPSMDVGTAFEAGYMSGKAKFCPDHVLIIGYYEGNVTLNFLDRIAHAMESY
jgi:nucleoside 2-deoxyribosyltransferase